MDASGPGAIVVAEPALYDLLAGQEIGWRLQERQESVAQMWDALSAGDLDAYSRVVVFSDSLRADEAGDADELAQTAWATAAMAGAGARVFVAVWRPDRVADLDRQILEAVRAQGLDPDRLEYHALPVAESARLVLETLREELQVDVAFPPQWSGSVEEPLRRVPEPVAGLPLRPPNRPPAGLPLAPPGRRSVEPEPVAAEPEPVAAEPEPVAVEPARAEPEPVTPELEPVAVESEPVEPVFVREVILDEGWLRPGLPPINGAVLPVDGWSSDHPPQAAADLLERSIPDGQVTIAVTSSKGGSGKTTVSVLLAASIVRASGDAGRRLSVAVVDLDTYHGQISSLVGTFMPTSLNIRVQPRWDEDCIRRSMVRADALGVDVLLAPVRPRTAEIVGPEFYRTIIRSLKRMYDVVILDTGNQYLDPLVADVALVEADKALFVTTMASTSIQGMARALGELTASTAEGGLGVPAERIGIVVNQAAAGVGISSDAVATAGLGVPVVGVVPLATKEVLTATNSSRMAELLDHRLLGPAYNELARTCLPSRALGTWREPVGPHAESDAAFSVGDGSPVGGAERRGLFRR